MNTDGEQSRRGTRLYTFPGGVFEQWGCGDDDTGPGVYLEFFEPRQTCNDARAFGPGEAERLGLAEDDGNEVASRRMDLRSTRHSQGPGVA